MYRYVLSAVAAALAAIMFCSCQGGSADLPDRNPDETTAAAAAPVTLDLREYRLIRPEDAPDRMIASSTELFNALCNTLSEMPGFMDDWIHPNEQTVIGDIREIVVGQTNRIESAAALAGLDDPRAFVIAVIGNKLVINSASSISVSRGVDYFVSQILPTAVNGVLTLDEGFRYVGEPAPGFDVVSGGRCYFDLVYSESLDAEATETPSRDRLDVEVRLAREIAAVIEAETGDAPGVTSDWTSDRIDVSAESEILIGATSRAESAAFLAGLAYNEYGFGTVGTKIVVAGWNETTTALAAEMFCSYVRGNTQKNADGVCSLSLPEDVREIAAVSDWLVDIPAYPNGRVRGTQDGGYNHLQIYIEETDEAAFRAYGEALQADGFSPVQASSVGVNRFAVYTGERGLVYLAFHADRSAARIITCPAGSYTLPEYLNAGDVPAYEKITSYKITQMTHNYDVGNFGMCYIITLEDGSFIVFDGGLGGSGDCDRLWNLLNELNERPDGKIVIAGWILTHEHSDHYKNFVDFCAKYGRRITLEGMYCCLTASDTTYNAYNPDHYITENFRSVSASVGGLPMYTFYTGMDFYIRGVRVEVLFTHHDLYPRRIYYYNDTSSVTRLTLGEQTAVFLGDARYEASAVLCEYYGDLLGSDIVQVSHHGWDGGTIALYGHINPLVAFWPSSRKEFSSQTGGAKGAPYDVDYFIRYGMAVDVCIPAQPTQGITLPYTRGDGVFTSKN